MSTTFLIQGTYMRLKFSSFSVPSASLSIFDVIAVLVIIPVMDYIVYPLLQRCGISFTPLRRIGVGFLMAAAAMMVAGFVEIKRRGLWEEGHVVNQVVNGEKKVASDLNIFWQIPQYFFIGTSEVLASITGKIKFQLVCTQTYASPYKLNSTSSPGPLPCQWRGFESEVELSQGLFLDN